MIPASIAVAVQLVALIYRRLRIAGYSGGASAVLSTLVLLQFALALAATPFAAIVFALMLYLTSVNATEFVRRRGARNVIALGGSLAGLQIVNPVAVIVTAILAPVLVGMDAHSVPRAQSVGLLVLLLFIPVCSALALTYLARELNFDPAQYLSGGASLIVTRVKMFGAHDPHVRGLICATCVAVSAFPAWMEAARSRTAAIVAVIAASVVLVVVAQTLLGLPISFASIAPSVAVLSAVAICEWSNPNFAIASLIMSAVLSWLSAVAVP